MTVLGLDLNASRVRAVHGPLGDFAHALPLDALAQELPLAINLELSTPELGSSALRISRQKPHLVCQAYLPHLGTTPVKRWHAGRHELDAEDALELLWKRLAPVCKQAHSVVLGLPGYLTLEQIKLLRTLGEKAKLPLAGSLPTPLAAALAGFADQAWFDSVLVVDVDDHAMTFALIRAVEGQAHLLETRSRSALGFHAWRERLLNALSDCCVLQSRRDPRASPLAEQGLFEQLDGLLEACHRGRMIQLGVQGSQWYQNLVIQPEQTVAFCGGLVRQTLHEVASLWVPLRADETPSVILLTASAGRLPGLTQALQNFAEDRHRQHVGPWKTLSMADDFGDNLVGDTPGDPGHVVVVGPDGPARAAHALGPLFHRGECPRGHLEIVAPLPVPPPVDAGPARLRYRGQEFFVDVPNFFLGKQDGCQLVVNDPRHPDVAARHCEIIFDHRTFILFNRSREATLVNDCPVAGSVVLRAGDWIRLGADGPALRFLGQAMHGRTPKTA